MKRSLHKILCFFLVMLLTPIVSLNVRAEDYSAVLHSLHYDIVLLEDGSALINEKYIHRPTGVLRLGGID